MLFDLRKNKQRITQLEEENCFLKMRLREMSQVALQWDNLFAYDGTSKNNALEEMTGTQEEKT